jgi:hypothetical protein
MTVEDALVIYVSHHLTTTGIGDQELVNEAISVLSQRMKELMTQRINKLLDES